MSVTVRANFDDLSRLDLTNRKLMRQIGLVVRERVVLRTIAGRDYRGIPFRPYSPSYAEAKRKAVGAHEGVNLKLSGRMLDDIGLSDVTDRSVTVGFRS